MRKPKNWDETKIIVPFLAIRPFDKIEARPELYREVRYGFSVNDDEGIPNGDRATA
ncbi:hypothetical protein ACX93W_07540 [Paenibacillus sp. CAU 1782]